MGRQKLVTEIPYQDIGFRSGEPFIIRKILGNFGQEEAHEPAHRHSFQEIIWIQSGTGHQLIDDRKISVEPNTFYLIGQGQVHQFISGKNLQGYIIRFTNEFLPAAYLITSNNFNSSIIGRFVTHNYLKIATEEQDDFNRLIQMLESEASLPDAAFGKENALQQLLIYLLVKLERRARISQTMSDNGVDGEERRVYSDFLSILESSYHKHHHLDHYATQVGLNKRRLSSIVRKMSGKTPKQVIIERLMNEAKRLLIYTDFSLKEITYLLGYNDPAYFCRIFKDQTSKSPLGFKKSHEELSEQSAPESLP